MSSATRRHRTGLLGRHWTATLVAVLFILALCAGVVGKAPAAPTTTAAPVAVTSLNQVSLAAETTAFNPKRPNCVPIGAHAKLSGVVDHGGADQSWSFGIWRGARTQIINDFIPATTWGKLTNTDWLNKRWKGSQYSFVLTAPMLPYNVKSATLAKGAKGAYDAQWRKLGANLVARGFACAVMRIGWENTGCWYRWCSVHAPKTYAAYWRHIVNAMRSVKGQHFRFEFNVSNQHLDPRAAYPGDKYVDYIGSDWYDESWTTSAHNHAAVWHEIANGKWGLNQLYAWAHSHHKRFALSEWGLVHTCKGGHSGEDDPYFVRSMKSWINGHDVAYELYFNSRDNKCQAMELNLFPKAKALYRTLW